MAMASVRIVCELCVRVCTVRACVRVRVRACVTVCMCVWRTVQVYGIDLPSAQELIAHGRTVDEVSAKLGCDWLFYNGVEVRRNRPSSLRCRGGCMRTPCNRVGRPFVCLVPASRTARRAYAN